MSAHLVNMKLSKKEAKNEFEPTPDKGPRFPHGLTIRLDDDSMKKLGFDSLPDVGEEFIVVGVGPVESANEHKRQKGVDRSMSIQLQRIEISPIAGGNEESMAKAIDDAIDDANTDHNTGHKT